MKNLLEKIKAWFKTKSLPFLKSYWILIVNMLVLFIAWNALSDAKDYPVAETITGLYIFLILGYLLKKLVAGDKIEVVVKGKPAKVSKVKK